PYALVKNLPNQTTEPVSNGADGLPVPEPRDKPAIDDREDGALGLHGGVRGLIQDASHLPVALRAAVTVVLARALLSAGAGAHPRSEVLGRGKRRGGGTDLCNDLLSGVHAQARDLGESMDRVMMVTEELRHLLIELSKVVFDHAQFFQCELHQSPIHRVQIDARAEGIA